jgi:hypothetical protein
MRSSSFKKSLTASAVLASSVAAAAGFAGSAQATSPGASNSPLTLQDGAWSPDGKRIAYVDTYGNVVTEEKGQIGQVVVDRAKPGVTRSHPTWFDNGAVIVFAEKTSAGSTLVAVPAYTAPEAMMQPVQAVDPLSFLVSKMTEGTESAPESNGKTLAFQHTVSGHEEIWVQDSFGRGSGGPIEATTDGTAPTVSPDGKTIAFLRKDASGDEQIWTLPWNGQSAMTPAGTPVQLTHDAHDHLVPTFSPDGTRIAFEQGPGKGAAATEVDSIAADGSGARQESATPGVPAYKPLNQGSMTRLAGADRIGTAIATSQAKWPTVPETPGSMSFPASAVVLSRSDQFADALGGSALASQKGGPLLLTPTDHLDTAVQAEIKRVLGQADTSKTVYVLGGEKALSPAVYDAVQSMGYTVKRVAGADRYSTSVAIAKQITGQNTPTRVLVATGNLFPDALSAGAAANASTGYSGAEFGVVVLTNDKAMPASTGAYLQQNAGNAQVYGVGGQADAALNSVGVKHTGLVGIDRFQTSYLVAETFFSGSLPTGDRFANPPRTVGFATGLNWADALSGGAYMGSSNGPLLLVNPATGWPSSSAEDWLSGWSSSLSSGYVFGGTAAVSDVGQSNLAWIMSGPAGMTTQLNPKA